MREYFASKTNLEIKVVTINGEEKVLKTTEPMNASKAMAIGNKWLKYEEVQEQKNNFVSNIKEEINNEDDQEKVKELKKKLEENRPDEGPVQIAKELAMVYDAQNYQWFLDNLDINTIRNILNDTAEELSGLKKSEVN